MKTLPGLKILGFLTLVLTVAFGVYAGTQHKPDSSSKQPNIIIKFGWEGATPDLSEPLEHLTFERALKLVSHFQPDPNLYVIRQYKDGVVVKSEGQLQTCVEPKPSPSSPTPTPSAAPTRSPVSPAAETTATPMGTKTQTNGAVALKVGHGSAFFSELNAASAGDNAGKAEKKK